MELRIFDLNDGFLRKKRFANVDNFWHTFMIFVPAALGNRLESIRKSYERFRDLSLNLVMTVTFVNRKEFGKEPSHFRLGWFQPIVLQPTFIRSAYYVYETCVY